MNVQTCVFLECQQAYCKLNKIIGTKEHTAISQFRRVQLRGIYDVLNGLSMQSCALQCILLGTSMSSICRKKIVWDRTHSCSTPVLSGMNSGTPWHPSETVRILRSKVAR